MVKIGVNNCAEHNSTDEELVRLYLESQDNRHFQKLYERYALKVYKKCVSLTKDATRAEDITHDVFLKLMSKMGTFKNDAKFSTWLFSVTYNHCMDLVRISKRKIVMVHEECDDFEDDINLYAIFEEEIDLKSLKAALGRLNLEEKALIYLKYLDDRSIRDIARMLHMTESAVKMRLMRSKQKLRKRYHEIFRIG